MSAAGRVSAVTAAALGLASAAVSLYWTAGGTALLDTVGGAIEDLARERSAGALAVGAVAAAIKVLAALLALALLRLGRRPRLRRPVLAANGLAAAVLVLWGGANVVVGGLVVAGAVTPSGGADERVLRWHVALWDLWFLVWGLAAAVATAAARRAG